MRFAFEDWQADGEEEYKEKEQAMAEASKVLRMADKEEIDEKLLAKAARRLQSKGYSSDVIYSVIGALRR